MAGGDFLKRMQARSKQVGEAGAAAVRAIGNTVGTELVLTTPVDTGAARSNWQASKGAARGGVVGIKSAPAAIGAIETVTANLKEGDDLYIANNLDYIGRLNQGSSQQAPAGFVESAVQRAGRAGGRVKVFK